MIAYYRNKMTGEIKEVEQDSAEMFALQEEVGPDSHSKWEQTSFAHTAAVKDRAAYGELDEVDLGKEHQEQLRHAAVQLDIEGVAPEANPHLALTPGEIEAGMTPESKLEDLRKQFDEGQLDERHGILNDAADTIADERQERPAAQQAKGLRARAGGSDEREGVPVATHTDDDGDAATPDTEKPGATPGTGGGQGRPAVAAQGSPMPAGQGPAKSEPGSGS